VTRTARRNWATTVLAAALLITGAGCSSDSSPSGRPTQAPTGDGSPGGTPDGQATTTPITAEPIPTGDPTKTPAGGLPKNVDGKNATAVAIAVVAVTNRHDTAIDNSRSDAQRRAVRWLDPTLAAQLAGGPAAAPGAEWNTWAKHRAYTTTAAVNSTEYGAPPDTATRADRTIAVTVQPIGRDRWRGPASQYAVFVTLTRTSAAAVWKVSQLQVQE
jgi:hypothetical protein